MVWDEALLWIAGICTAILSIIGLVSKLAAPIKALQDRVTKLEDKVDSNETHLRYDKKAFDKQEHFNNMCLKSLVLLLEHEATGNHTGEMQQMATEIKGFIYSESAKLK